jgi:hypothetical protein
MFTTLRALGTELNLPDQRITAVDAAGRCRHEPCEEALLPVEEVADVLSRRNFSWSGRQSDQNRHSARPRRVADAAKPAR